MITVGRVNNAQGHEVVKANFPPLPPNRLFATATGAGGEVPISNTFLSSVYDSLSKP